jgi:hypothetical protein
MERRTEVQLAKNRGYKSEKRRKELNRTKKQEEKRQRRFDREKRPEEETPQAEEGAAGEGESLLSP